MTIKQILQKWEEVTYETINNAFLKAHLKISLYSVVTNTSDNNDFYIFLRIPTLIPHIKMLMNL